MSVTDFPIVHKANKIYLRNLSEEYKGILCTIFANFLFVWSCQNKKLKRKAGFWCNHFEDILGKNEEPKLTLKFYCGSPINVVTNVGTPLLPR